MNGHIVCRDLGQLTSALCSDLAERDGARLVWNCQRSILALVTSLSGACRLSDVKLSHVSIRLSMRKQRFRLPRQPGSLRPRSFAPWARHARVANNATPARTLCRPFVLTCYSVLLVPVENRSLLQRARARGQIVLQALGQSQASRWLMTGSATTPPRVCRRPAAAPCAVPAAIEEATVMPVAPPVGPASSRAPGTPLRHQT